MPEFTASEGFPPAARRKLADNVEMEETSRAKGLATDTFDADSLPQIFLSHSGEQKPGFVTHLYHALHHANHRPFFDTDPIHSLPVGLDYPPRIFQACKACEMGVVVLSEHYITSLWPMLELQHLMLPTSNARFIYPLFYELQPADLSHSENISRWKKCWEENKEKWQQRMSNLQKVMSYSGWDVDIGLDVSSWANNLDKLQYRSGDVRNIIHLHNERTRYQSEYAYIEAVVSHICALLPPPAKKYFLDDAVKGQEHMKQEIDKAFEEKDSLGADDVRIIGVNGIGGSGKTTMCKMLTNFFTNEFGARCFFIELATNGNEVEKLLLQNTEAILERLSAGSPSKLDHVDQAMGLLQEGLLRDKVFLAIDNVWGHVGSEHRNFDMAKRIMLMKFLPGSKILVTSRSKKVLTCLLQERLNNMASSSTNQEHSVPPTCPRIIHVPSLSEAEAVEAIKSYSCFSSFIPKNFLQHLASSCFFQGQCHPLYLKLKGIELQMKGRASFDDQKWEDLISSLQSEARGNAHDDTIRSSEEAVKRCVERSLDILPSHLQNLFIDLVAWRHHTSDHWYRGLVDGPVGEDFLCFHYNDGTKDQTFYQVLELEYHGLLEVKDKVDKRRDWGVFAGGRLVIHDLHRLVAESRVSLPQYANTVVNHAVLNWDLSQVLSHELVSKKYVCGDNLKASALITLFGSRKVSGSCFRTKTAPVNQVQIQVLHLYESLERGPCKSLDFLGGSMEALRYLSLRGFMGIREIKGWEGVPNLVWLGLIDLIGLERMGPLGCLKRLETLHLETCKNLQVQVLVGGANCASLLKVGDCLPKLEVLRIINGNVHLVEMGSILPDTFPVLKTLVLESCEKLEKFPDLKLASLKTLRLMGCPKLRSMEGSICSLTALEHLELKQCGELVSIPDLRNLKNLWRLGIKECWLLMGEVRLNLTNPLEHLSIDCDRLLKYHNSSGDQGDLSVLGDAVQVACDYKHGGGIKWTIGDLNPFVNVQSLSIELTGFIVEGTIRQIYSTKLRWLHLSSFQSVEKLSICPNSLGSLEALIIINFPNLKEISGFGAGHSRLNYVRIDCPMLVRALGMRALPGLRRLELTSDDGNVPIAVAEKGAFLEGSFALEKGATYSLSCLTSNSVDFLQREIIKSNFSPSQLIGNQLQTRGPQVYSKSEMRRVDEEALSCRKVYDGNDLLSSKKASSVLHQIGRNCIRTKSPWVVEHNLLLLQRPKQPTQGATSPTSPRHVLFGYLFTVDNAIVACLHTFCKNVRLTLKDSDRPSNGNLKKKTKTLLNLDSPPSAQVHYQVSYTPYLYLTGLPTQSGLPHSVTRGYYFPRSLTFPSCKSLVGIGTGDFHSCQIFLQRKLSALPTYFLLDIDYLNGAANLFTENPNVVKLIEKFINHLNNLRTPLLQLILLSSLRRIREIRRHAI
ncbi:hypothetical protein GOP47_0004140 [Adiantum capillus-veneris]|uniref:TIR domain-containing protein n=1 Tax=Adiantum capillus-veneris TaxID=13818 RepID=A0A9D4V7L1_ADICA|nr:hypothetical protein GOP47_0004140 [Adiantum capillus-veneris]